MLEFETAFKYPFKRPSRLLYILWALLPIFGWFALIGYQVRLVKEWIKGRFDELPQLHFADDMVFGFWMFIKGLPLFIAWFIVVMVLGKIPLVGMVATIVIGVFVLPMLYINFFKYETVESSFAFAVVQPVFDNLGEYVIAFLKDFALSIIFLVFALVLVGIPAGSFTKNIFLVDFYARLVR